MGERGAQAQITKERGKKERVSWLVASYQGGGMQGPHESGLALRGRKRTQRAEKFHLANPCKRREKGEARERAKLDRKKAKKVGKLAPRVRKKNGSSEV